MRYADQILYMHKNNRWVIKMSLEKRLKYAYGRYKDFCYSVGIKPQKIIDFLKTEVI